MKTVVFVLSVALLLGCASPVPKQRDVLESSNASASMQELTATKLELSKPIASELTAHSPVLVIDSAKSYVSLYEIPANSNGTIHVIGHCHCDYAPVGYWLFPQITLLDSKYQVISSGPELDLRARAKNYLSALLVLQGSLALPDEPNTVKYVLVHTSPRYALAGVLLRHRSQQITTVGALTVASGTNTSSNAVPSSPVGKYEITLLPKGTPFPDGASFEAPPFGVIFINARPKE